MNAERRAQLEAAQNSRQVEKMRTAMAVRKQKEEAKAKKAMYD